MDGSPPCPRIQCWIAISVANIDSQQKKSTTLMSGEQGDRNTMCKRWGYKRVPLMWDQLAFAVSIVGEKSCLNNPVYRNKFFFFCVSHYFPCLKRHVRVRSIRYTFRQSDQAAFLNPALCAKHSVQAVNSCAQTFEKGG